MTGPFFCIHGVHWQVICKHCEKDIRQGWIRERKVYTYQERFKKRLVRQGRCKTCGKLRGDSPYKYTCIPCEEKIRARMRKIRGWKEWVPGGRGRPVKTRIGRKKSSD